MHLFKPLDFGITPTVYHNAFIVQRRNVFLLIVCFYFLSTVLVVFISKKIEITQ